MYFTIRVCSTQGGGGEEGGLWSQIGNYKLTATPDTHVIFLHIVLLHNDTCSLTGVHNVQGGRGTEEVLHFISKGSVCISSKCSTVKPDKQWQQQQFDINKIIKI